MSHHERPAESEQPLVDNGKGSSNSRGGSSKRPSNGTTSTVNGYNNVRTSNSRDGDFTDSQNQKNLEASFNSQQKILEAKLRKLQICLYVFGGIVTAGFVILITLCAVFFAKLHHDMAHHTHKPTLSAQMAAILEEGVCVSCDDFRLGASAKEEDVLNKFIDESSGRGRAARCCANTGSELLELLKLFIERKFRLELAKGTVPGTLANAGKDGAGYGVKPAAHLMMAEPDYSVQHYPGRQQMIKRWRFKGDMAFLAGGAEYSDGRIVVPMDGYYFVYCHISFTDFFVNNKGGSGGTSPNLSVYLYRYNILYDKGGEETLARNSITKCESQSKEFAEYVISLGAVFYLRRQDHILIKVSNLTIVDTSPKGSYFGFFKI